MKRTGAMLLAAVLALALAAPAAAEAPKADGWAGWTWSTVIDWLGGWTQGLWGVQAGSTDGEEPAAEEEPEPESEVPVLLLEGEEQGTQPQAYPLKDPDG